MKRIYPKDIDVRYDALRVAISIPGIAMTSIGMVMLDEGYMVFRECLDVMFWISVFLCFWYMVNFVHKITRGYWINNGRLETRLCLGKWRKIIELSKVKGVCICYGYNTHGRMGPTRLKRTVRKQGKRMRVPCLWFSLLSANLKYVFNDMSNRNIEYCTGEEEIYGFAAFNDECIKEFVENYTGMYYITSDIYEKNIETLERYNIPTEKIRVIPIKVASE